MTKVLLSEVIKHNHVTYESIPEALRTRLENLLAGSGPGHHMARIILARVVDWLYRVNPKLGSSLLDKFEWDHAAVEARGLWQGYLSARRLTPELWERFRSAFLGVLWHWWKSLLDRGDRAPVLYRERLRHLLRNVWPLELDLRDDSCSSHMTRIAIACGSEFPDAVETVLPYIVPVTEPHMAACDIEGSGNLERFPRPCLMLFKAICGDSPPPYSAPHTRQWLNRIQQADSSLAADADFQAIHAAMSKVPL